MTTANRPTSRRRDQPPPGTAAGERETLLAFLDYLRESAIGKVEGVPEPQVREPGVGSGTNLLGLVKHLTAVERFTFLGTDVDDWQATFHATDDETIDGIIADYRDAIAALTEPADRPTNRGSRPTMRWALTHMIEETGRHAGHLDILRELVDGRTAR